MHECAESKVAVTAPMALAGIDVAAIDAAAAAAKKAAGEEAAAKSAKAEEARKAADAELRMRLSVVASDQVAINDPTALYTPACSIESETANARGRHPSSLVRGRR